jgi:hypothetical protein
MHVIGVSMEVSMRAFRTLGILVVAAMLVAAGASFAQDKPAAGQEKKTAAAADPLSGDWEGSVETQNGAIAFTLKLKLENDKVIGEIGSQEGSTSLSGTWTDGKLSASFDYNGTPVTMGGTLKDGALSGEMSFGGGQSLMTYSAKKQAAK